MSSLSLRLLRAPAGVDADLATPDGAVRRTRDLSALVLAGFAGHALCMALTFHLIGDASAPDALLRGGAWFVACAGGFFAAVAAGLPSYWFYGVVARIPAPSWRLAVETVRVQAVGSVMLGAVLPIWLTATLALWMVGADLSAFVAWKGVSLSLPFLAGLPGIVGLVGAFRRMAVANGDPAPWRAVGLAAWWVTLFVTLAPATVHTLFVALGGG
jgi:hypothetical protein